MPDDSVACRLIMDQLRSINDRLDIMSDDISDLKNAKAISDGERSALAKIGAGFLGLCTAVGVVVTLTVNWAKFTGHE